MSAAAIIADTAARFQYFGFIKNFLSISRGESYSTPQVASVIPMQKGHFTARFVTRAETI